MDECVACHLLASQSDRVLDAPLTLAQLVKVSSYALVFGEHAARQCPAFRSGAASCRDRPSPTGLSNYRTLIHVMESEIQRSHRTRRPFAVLVLDLDGLKGINDRHGHLVGTRAICRLANVLRANSRLMDTAARYGGDEFVVVLPEADTEAVALVSKRVCERLATDGEFPQRNRQPCWRRRVSQTMGTPLTRFLIPPIEPCTA